MAKVEKVNVKCPVCKKMVKWPKALIGLASPSGHSTNCTYLDMRNSL